MNVAQLQICGGIAGKIQKCQGAPKSTTGKSGNVQFSIKPVKSGATINISKGRWEREYPCFSYKQFQCELNWFLIEGIKAAFAVCGQDKPFTATFVGGASTGDVNVVLKQV